MIAGRASDSGNNHPEEPLELDVYVGEAPDEGAGYFDPFFIEEMLKQPPSTWHYVHSDALDDLRIHDSAAPDGLAATLCDLGTSEDVSGPTTCEQCIQVVKTYVPNCDVEFG